jgi:hypothetical protein
MSETMTYQSLILWWTTISSTSPFAAMTYQSLILWWTTISSTSPSAAGE